MTDLIGSSLFYQLAAVLILAGLCGTVAYALRQPLIVAFIAAGLLAGPDVLNIVSAGNHTMEMMAHMGIAVLLFMVGLKLDMSLVRTMGGVALATGIGQVLFTAVIGFLICMAFGFGVVSSLYVSIALTFSSTIIIVKLLSDKHEIDSLHGRIALGFLIVQDIFVVLCMVLLSAFGIGGEGSSLSSALLIVTLKSMGLIGFTTFFILWIAHPLMSFVARSPELMVTFAISWAVAFAAMADFLGFSIELGGLLAGVSLASTPYRDALVSRLSSLRDFMLLFFFITLGSKMDLNILGAQLVPAVVLSVFVLVGNPLIVMVIMGYMGYRKRTGFLAGLTVAQISEFSLIFMAMGITLGHVGKDMLGLVTLIGLVTISLSTYMITYSQNLYTPMERFLSLFERKNPFRERGESTARRGRTYDVILFGLGRYGSAIARDLLDRGVRVLGIDFDPNAVRNARKNEPRKTFDVAYGDVTDPGFAAHLPLDKAGWIVCAVPQHFGTLQDEDSRMTLLSTLKEHQFKGKVAIVSHSEQDGIMLRKKGADLILTPFADAAQQAVLNLLGKK